MFYLIPFNFTSSKYRYSMIQVTAVNDSGQSGLEDQKWDLKLLCGYSTLTVLSKFNLIFKNSKGFKNNCKYSPVTWIMRVIRMYIPMTLSLIFK